MGKSSLWAEDDILAVKFSRDDDDRFDDDDDEYENSSSSSSSSSSDDDDDDDDSSSSSSSDDDDDFVRINGVLVKVRSDGSIDDSQPSGVRFTNNGLKLRGDGSIDDSQPYGLFIAGTRRNDKLIGTGLFVDNVSGLRGDDNFICGNRRSSFYLDNKGQSETYMSIKDFRRGDNTLICSGDRSDYRITMIRNEGVRGVGVFFRDSDGQDLVAFLEKANRRHLRGDGLEFLS
jgi:hypothetical protein